MMNMKKICKRICLFSIISLIKKMDLDYNKFEIQNRKIRKRKKEHKQWNSATKQEANFQSFIFSNKF